MGGTHPIRMHYCYHPQTNFAKVMFLHLSVGHSVHRGVCMAGGFMWQVGHVWRDACVAGGHVWQGCVHGQEPCMAGGRHVSQRRSVHGRGPCMPCMAPGHYQIWSVNAWAVRILLECILVFSIIFINYSTLPTLCNSRKVDWR